MKTLAAWLLWTFLAGATTTLGWRKIQHHVKVYLLILVSGLYLSGIFFLYAVLNRIPVW